MRALHPLPLLLLSCCCRALSRQRSIATARRRWTSPHCCGFVLVLPPHTTTEQPSPWRTAAAQATRMAPTSMTTIWGSFARRNGFPARRTLMCVFIPRRRSRRRQWRRARHLPVALPPWLRPAGEWVPPLIPRLLRSAAPPSHTEHSGAALGLCHPLQGVSWCATHARAVGGAFLPQARQRR